MPGIFNSGSGLGTIKNPMQGKTGQGSNTSKVRLGLLRCYKIRI